MHMATRDEPKAGPERIHETSAIILGDVPEVDVCLIGLVVRREDSSRGALFGDLEVSRDASRLLLRRMLG